LPDPEHDPKAHAEVALSHPVALFERMTALFGVVGALRLCRHNNAEPPTIIRLFRGVSRDQLSVDGVSVLAHDQAGMLVIQGARQPLLAEWARRGLAQVQDPTSALVVEQLDIQPGQAILDRCAGLGTKTLQMRDRLGESGSIVAVDPNGGRCEGLRRIVAARGIRNIPIHQVDMLSKIRVTLPQQFDRVLVDVPCSNSGVLPRRPEAKYHQQDRALRSLGCLQKAILDDTAPSVAHGGQLLYSTCSIWPEENQQIVEAFLSGDSQFRLVRQHFTPPSLDQNPTTYRDGGYYALLERVL
jgi:16S rRNA (cytosine967-C5)-methyltransferase